MVSLKMGIAIFDNRIMRTAGSLSLSLWLLLAQLLLFLAGAIQMPLFDEYRSMNSMPLIEWMRLATPTASWWLWASVAAMALLALNTLTCGAEAVLSKRSGREWFQVLPPQIIHLGFLFMIAGHLLSSAGATHIQQPMREGSAIRLLNGSILRLGSVEIDISPEGYPLDWAARLEYYSPAGELIGRGVSAPNRPAFIDGQGIYIKQAAYGGALMEIHRDPGTPWALGGGALFTIGTIALIGLKMQRER